MIYGKVQNKNASLNILKNLAEKERELDILVSKKAIVLNSMIKASLVQSIGEKAKYYDIKIKPRRGGVEIIVVATDNVGIFLYKGTSAHDISSSFTPMPMPDGGFSRSVRHPGTKSMKTEIDAAIRSAITNARFFD